VTALQSIGALAGLFAVMAVPRLAQGWRLLLLLTIAGAVIGAAFWFGWAANLASATDRAVPLIGLIAVGAAFGFGVLIRAVVLFGRMRGWPKITDLVMNLGVAVMFSYGFLRLFDVL
jgi:hypothetical protein